jgi:4-hydroxy-tetrahydrodipicolinate synthase
MEKGRFQGTGTALITPFTSDGEVDEAALVRVVDHQLDNGIDMILPCGTTGESPALENNEWERIVSLVVERVNKRVPVIVGAGSNSTAHAVAMTKSAHRLGADAVLSVGPYYNRPQQDGYYAHFKAVAEAADIPVLVYNVPSRTGGNIHPQTTLRLAELPGIVGVKEATGSVDQAAEIIRHRPAGFRVLSGDDSLTLALIAMGADGVVSVTSNQVPGLFTQMVDAALSGDVSRAGEIHYRLLRLMRANFIETSPVPVKALMAMMGLIEESYRLPLVKPREGTRSELREAAEELGLLK